MPRVAFRQAEVERLLRAARRQGFENPAVEKRPDGALVLLTHAPTPRAHEPAGGGADLDAELEEWRARHGHG